MKSVPQKHFWLIVYINIHILMMKELTVWFAGEHVVITRSHASLLPMRTRNSWSPDDAPVFTMEAFPARVHVNESARRYFSPVQVAWEFSMLGRRIPEWRRIPYRTIRRVRLESGSVPRRAIRISRKGFSARVLTLCATSRRHTSLLP